MLNQTEGRSSGHEVIDAHKTLVCEGFQYTYRLDGSHFEIIPPEELGSGSCKSLLTQGHIQMTDFNLMFNRDMEANGEFKTPRTELVFCLGDGIEWGTTIAGDAFAVERDEVVLLHGGGRSENCRYEQNAHYRFLSIDMSPEHFGRLTEELSGDERLRLSGGEEVWFARNKITPAIRQILAQIADCTYSGGVRKLYLESKMLELFAVYLNESLYEAQRISSGVRLSKEDIRSLQLAKELLQRDYAQPPTLAGLSRLICLNEFKLKKGFKEMFGTTVHAYVIEQRLEHARQMLEQGRMSVSEVAAQVGYGNISHFAAAFRKKFAASPGEYAVYNRSKSARG